MSTLDFSRSPSLNNIPKRKLTDHLVAIESSNDDLKTKNLKITAINRYAESNIPIEYWALKMDKDFQGDNRLLDKYKDYTLDLKKTYTSGQSICFAGSHGLGKTMTMCCVLKTASLKGYSCLYTTLTDMVSVLTQGSIEDKFIAKKELSMVDFLVIDEVDQRFFRQSDNANETFARTLESILRGRLQNKLPILMATNSPQIKETFVTQFKDSLGSLMSKIEMFIVMPGPDFRKNK